MNESSRHSALLYDVNRATSNVDLAFDTVDSTLASTSDCQRQRIHDATSKPSHELLDRLLKRHDANDANRFVRVLAPMVRYSKLPFRLLCRSYGCDLTFTPMMIASSFYRSSEARDADFSTCHDDEPLVAQFGVTSAVDMALCAPLIAPHVAAIDVNCGCPQSWAMNDGMGAALMSNPKLVSDIIKSVRSSGVNLPVSVKCRIHNDLRRTVDWIRQVEAAGVAWISVHGRTTAMRRGSQVNLDAIKQIVDLSSVPIIANGDACINEATSMQSIVDQTGSVGVMVARAALSNPSLFNDQQSHSSLECLNRYIDLACQYGGRFNIHLYHLHEMMTFPTFNKHDRNALQECKSMAAVIDLFEEKGWRKAD